ncbi:MFS transporter [Sphingomonas canadensis]|uniref:MFS transporter n=1 Tax=Sphingomonas canadensis TaxID=1219257 RepID=A0ABW3HAR9_9SPHN|nr:MFS transporter [Sphingomonas canadensis]MCW3838290.1 MFS transporter [Sphingomonas canadensis]
MDRDGERAVDVASAATLEGEVPSIGNPQPAAKRPSLLIPMTVGATFFMEGLDSTIIATSLPQIAHALNVTPNEIGVSLTAYLVSVSMWMAASGWLADRFEARRVFIGAIAVFVLGSVVCGISSDLYTLVAGRFLQGAGGALMTPVGRLILARSFPRDELVRAMSYMIVPGLLGPMLGPVVGGWITTYWDWRWIFFINVPLGLAGIVLALHFLDRSEPTQAAKFDGWGFVIVAVTLVALQTGFEAIAAESRVGMIAWIALGIGAAGIALYARHARRADPILDLRLFRYRAFAVAVLGGSFSRLVLGATMFLFPLYFQLGLGGSAVVAGYLMAVLAFGQIALRLGIDPLLKKLGVKRLLIFNSAVLGLLLASLLLFQPGASFWLLGGFMFLFGLIHSIQLSTLAGLNFSGLPQEALGRATSVAAVVQRLSMALGISATAILLAFSSDAGVPVWADFVAPTLALAGVMALSVVSFLTLRPGDGADLMKAKR